ncbi:DUF4403 family protein [Aquabacterium soli]|uniref:DUF4403 family protein n=2 Tax=Aquabacterium soli TaxID=2493092 RepID=A0A426V9U2_9BURK|nr:DUF4403 family protein [Aquabacterium soli]
MRLPRLVIREVFMLRRLRAVLLFVSTLHLAGCAGLYRYDAISEKPAFDAADTPLTPRPSTIQPVLSMPLATLQDGANSAVGRLLPFTVEDGKRLASIEIMKPPWLGGGCFFCEYLDAKWQYTVNQPRPVVLKGEQNRLVVDVSAAIDGGVGFKGDIARLLSLTNKRFDAALSVNFKSGLAANIDFCPALTGVELDYSWITPPYFQIIGRNCLWGVCFGPANIEFDSAIDNSLRPQLPTVAANLQKAIPCQPVRDALAKAWRGYTFPVKVPYEELHLNIRPQALYLPGLNISATDLNFTGNLEALVSLDQTPISTDPLPLPPNTPATISPGRFSLAVPISTRYYTFEALTKQALTLEPFGGKTPAGDVKVTFKDVQFYPTTDGQMLAIGVSAAVEFRWLWFLNSSGTIWLTARPQALDQGRKIRLSDVKVTRKFTNPIWDLVSLLLDDKLTEVVRNDFEMDLNPTFAQAEADITAMINSAGQDGSVTLQARDVKIAVGRMLANEQTFQVEALFDAIVDAKLGKVSLP